LLAGILFEDCKYRAKEGGLFDKARISMDYVWGGKCFFSFAKAPATQIK
jgi:hypothetical protein